MPRATLAALVGSTGGDLERGAGHGEGVSGGKGCASGGLPTAPAPLVPEPPSQQGAGGSSGRGPLGAHPAPGVLRYRRSWGEVVKKSRKKSREIALWSRRPPRLSGPRVRVAPRYT